MAKGWHRKAVPDEYTNEARQDYIGVRLGVELRARVGHAAQTMGISVSEWVRMSVAHSLDYGLAGLADIADPRYAGFSYGRQLGMALAQAQIAAAIRSVLQQMPISFEEAQERFPDGEGLTY